jgi:hypothetical protein
MSDLEDDILKILREHEEGLSIQGIQFQLENQREEPPARLGCLFHAGLPPGKRMHNEGRFCLVLAEVGTICF